MKGFLLSMLLCAATLGAMAQEARKFTINGHLTDVDSKGAMEHVSIQLFWAADSAFVGGTVSDNRGNFSVDVPKVGTFRLKISFVGYQTLEREVTLRREQNMDLGNIRMVPDDLLLKEAVVKANAALVVALNFYDLLRQQSNYERWVSATGRSDTRYNSINSYAMLHVRYRLNMFGGKVDTEGRYDKKWGNRDRR